MEQAAAAVTETGAHATATERCLCAQHVCTRHHHPVAKSHAH